MASSILGSPDCGLVEGQICAHDLPINAIEDLIDAFVGRGRPTVIGDVEGANGDVHLEVKSISAGASKTVQTTESEGVLVTFDGADGTTIKFDFEPDPVMVLYNFIIFAKLRIIMVTTFFVHFREVPHMGHGLLTLLTALAL